MLTPLRTERDDERAWLAGLDGVQHNSDDRLDTSSFGNNVANSCIRLSADAAP